MSNRTAPTPSLLDVTRQKIPVHRGFLPWYDKLPAEMQREADAVKAAYLAGTLGTKSAVATALSDALQSRGVRIGRNGVMRWLEKQP